MAGCVKVTSAIECIQSKKVDWRCLGLSTYCSFFTSYVLAALTNFLNKSLAADMEGKEKTNVEKTGKYKWCCFHCYYLLLYSGLNWPEMVQQRANGKQKLRYLRDQHYQEPVEESVVDHSSL